MTHDLIAALEAAEAGSRELDARIALFTDNPYPYQCPAYTTSLDAARSLSDWLLVHISEIGADGLALVELGNPSTSPPGEAIGIHSRLEIAWCIAALRAREG